MFNGDTTEAARYAYDLVSAIDSLYLNEDLDNNGIKGDIRFRLDQLNVESAFFPTHDRPVNHSVSEEEWGKKTLKWNSEYGSQHSMPSSCVAIRLTSPRIKRWMKMWKKQARNL